MPAAILGPIAGSVVGGLMSDGEEQTATKEPWAAAAPWLKSNIAQGQNLQAYYQQNPFNAMQQTGYQNLFSDLDNFRTNMAPGLMQFANNAMTGSYQRPQYSKPGDAGYGGNRTASQGPGAGLTGLLSMGQQPAQASYGLLDFNALNPYNGALKPAEIKQPDQQTIEQAVQAELERRQREQEYAGSAAYGGFA